MKWRSWLVCTVAIAWPGVAVAAPVMIPLDSENDLFAEGFEHHPDAGTSTFDAGLMTVDSVGYEEWILYAPTASKWWNEVLPEKGWWIEVRLRIDETDPGCPDVGPGLWIHDRGKLIKVFFASDHVQSYPTGASAPFDTTSDFHVYRVEDFGDGTRHLLVDGAMLLDLAGDQIGGGTEALTFGDLGGCAHSRAVWDYYSYDTFAPGSEDGDVDVDGIPNADDNCFDVANPDQLDTDGDARGDVCDPCPIDAYDDRDGDGACDSDDACPDDPSATEEPCPVMETGFEVGPWEGGEFGSDSLDGGSVSLDSGSATMFTAGSASGATTIGESLGQTNDDDGCNCTTGSTRGGPLFLLAMLALGVSRRSLRGRGRCGRARRASPA
jgi:MYXO-CTERM domain-containing protein